MRTIIRCLMMNNNNLRLSPQSARAQILLGSYRAIYGSSAASVACLNALQLIKKFPPSLSISQRSQHRPARSFALREHAE